MRRFKFMAAAAFAAGAAGLVGLGLALRPGLPAAEVVSQHRLTKGLGRGAVSRDGTLAALVGGGEMRVHVVPTAGGPGVTLDGYRSSVSAVAFNPRDAAELAVAAYHELAVWNTRTGELRARLGGAGAVLALAYSPDGGKLYAGGENGQVCVWDTGTWEVILRQVLAPHTINVLAAHPAGGDVIAFGTDRSTVAAVKGTRTIMVGQPTEVSIVSLASGATARPKELVRMGDTVESLVFSQDGERLAVSAAWNSMPGGLAVVSGCLSESPVVTRLAQQAPRAWFRSSVMWTVNGLSFACGGRYLIGASRGGVLCWEPKAGPEAIGYVHPLGEMDLGMSVTDTHEAGLIPVGRIGDGLVEIIRLEAPGR